MRPLLGASLIELLISLLILSLFFLGFDAMQITALNAIKSEYYFGIAIAQLEAMVERLKMLQVAPFEEQQASWNQQNLQILPQGLGSVTGSYPAFHLELRWGGKKQCNKNKMGQRGCIKIFIKI